MGKHGGAWFAFVLYMHSSRPHFCNRQPLLQEQAPAVSTIAEAHLEGGVSVSAHGFWWHVPVRTGTTRSCFLALCWRVWFNQVHIALQSRHRPCKTMFQTHHLRETIYSIWLAPSTQQFVFSSSRGNAVVFFCMGGVCTDGLSWKKWENSHQNVLSQNHFVKVFLLNNFGAQQEFFRSSILFSWCLLLFTASPPFTRWKIWCNRESWRCMLGP